ncbi:LLM class flavin-dependent oxidoreductase [Amycolatopsis jiangsuensis]|uniref:Alkanesulfonate monooxygenase SsuD/methylene tetrahydromethanopterin reductase-like flavin-dependent oxidoreductase (Luciferase family) n=1 Tax=Amycolatopsis jiangsuensis TaxID=1181879 RepID=A0A840J812_9PSEU|nr:LLM class flavin-dependent oxidoreductase [Amycolatopsis jiangsuensis]MBB4689562.1 alkanesulfonate monooxygenase SsuD/methylene tetrahydromethanopterin reductase-like flavin-dependent oxidoreductase (luciferase family) [Amycolatopsis jiangsuensis]
MNYEHSLEFGLLLGAGDRAPEDAAVAEKLGYDLVMVSGASDAPGLHGLTLAGWVAARTSTIRVHAEVPMSGPEPSMLARTVATLDRLSGGRAELAVEADARATSAEAAGEVDETLDIVHALWNVGERGLARAGGRFHHVAGARKAAPIHDVPISIKGAQKPVLELAGRKADGWSSRYVGVDALADGNRVVDGAACAAGRAPGEIRRIITVEGHFGERDGEFTGRAADWVQDLLPLVVEHGVGTVVLGTADVATVTKFAEDVIPSLRAAVDSALPHGAAGRPIRKSSALALRRAGIDYDHVPDELAAALEPGDFGYSRFGSGYLRGGAPGLVLRAATTDQVVAALAFARRHPALPLSRRSAGHGISGRSTNDGGIVIDVSLMNSIEILDESTRRVRIGPGARWMDVAAALHPHGWALSSGDYGGVGVGGLATAGGIGYLAREHGLTIDHVRAVEMVLADGSVVRASDTENTDLFWAVRGAGANFGIVTSFEFEVDEVGPIGYAELTHGTDDPPRFLQDWGRFVEDSPRDLTSFLIVVPFRPGQPPYALSRTVVDSADPDTVVARLQPLAELAPLYAQEATMTSYAALMANAGEPVQSRGEPVSRSGLLRHITPEFAAAATRVLYSGGIHWFQIRSVGGAVSDVPADATAYANRAANFSVVVMGRDDDVVDTLWSELEPFFEGLYLSFDSSLRPGRITDAWPAPTLARLRALKAEYDRDGVFDDNFSLAPNSSSRRGAR